MYHKHCGYDHNNELGEPTNTKIQEAGHNKIGPQNPKWSTYLGNSEVRTYGNNHEVSKDGHLSTGSATGNC